MKVKRKHMLFIIKWCVYDAEIILYFIVVIAIPILRFYIVLYKLTTREKQDEM